MSKYEIFIIIFLISNFALLYVSIYLFIKNERKNCEMEEKTKLATIDELTQIYNRRQIWDIFEENWKKCLNEKIEIAFMIIDVDYFKEYNDNYGHPEGDKALKKIAEILRQKAKSKNGYAGRYGGDEFVMVFPNMNSIEAMHTADEILFNLKEMKIEHKYSPASKYKTISVGVATIVPKDGMNKEELFKNADSALYQSKRYGRNRAHLYKKDKKI